MKLIARKWLLMSAGNERRITVRGEINRDGEPVIDELRLDLDNGPRVPEELFAGDRLESLYDALLTDAEPDYGATYDAAEDPS